MVFALLLMGVSAIFGQTPSTQKDEENAKAPKDPFAKEGKGKPAADPKNGAERKSFQQIVQVVEFIEAPHADFRNWLKANPGSPDGDALRAEVQKWIEAGSAEVLASQMSFARSGQRVRVESIRELIYPSKFYPIQWLPSTPFPAAFQTRNLGMSLEFDPVMEDETVYLNQASEWIELVGNSQGRPEPEGAVQAGDVRIPLIHSNRVTGQVREEPGKWMLIDVESARSKDPDSTAAPLNPEGSVLVFSRSSIHESEAPLPKAADKGASAGDGGQIYVKLEWIDVEQSVATRWLQNDDLAEWVGGAEGARAAAEKLVAAGDAEVAFTRMIPCRSGQRAKSETIREVIYPTEFDPSEQHALSTPGPLETRNTGVTVELDPVISKSGTVVDLNMAPEIVELVGHSVSQRYFDLKDQQWKPDVMMPIFYTMRVTTQVTTIIDQPLFVCMMMPNDENGLPDPDKRRLLFVTVTR